MCNPTLNSCQRDKQCEQSYAISGSCPTFFSPICYEVVTQQGSVVTSSRMRNWRRFPRRAIRIRDKEVNSTSAGPGPHPHERNLIWRSNQRLRDGAQAQRRALSMIRFRGFECQSLSLACANCEELRRARECAEIHCSKASGIRK